MVLASSEERLLLLVWVSSSEELEARSCVYAGCSNVTAGQEGFDLVLDPPSASFASSAVKAFALGLAATPEWFRNQKPFLYKLSRVFSRACPENRNLPNFLRLFIK